MATKKTEVKKQAESRGKGVTASRKDNTAIGKWKKLHQSSKVIKLQVDEVKASVLGVVVAAHADFIESKFGTILLRTRETLDFADLKKRLVGGGFIEEAALEALIRAATKAGDPYIQAPNEWSAELKLGSELEEAA